MGETRSEQELCRSLTTDLIFDRHTKAIASAPWDRRSDGRLFVQRPTDVAAHWLLGQLQDDDHQDDDDQNTDDGADEASAHDYSFGRSEKQYAPNPAVLVLEHS